MDSISEAIAQSNYEQAQVLLSGGAKWDLSGYMERQAVENIVNNEAFDLLAMLFEKDILSLDIFEYDDLDGSVFEALIETSYTEKLYDFLQGFVSDVENIDDDVDGKTWLGLALAAKADPQFLELLVNAGCDINRINGREENYLFSVKDLALAEFLINQGLDINKKRVDGRTPLFGAVKDKNMELIQLYLDNGADVNVQDIKKETVYNIVCFELIDPEVFDALANIDPPRHDLLNTNNQSLLMQFAQSSIDWDAAIQLLEKIIDSGGDLWENSQDAYGKAITPADMLAKKDVDILQMLIARDDFDPSALDDSGNNWLHKVNMENLNFEDSKAKALYKKIKLLLKAGVDPTLKNDADKSPMDYAQDDNLKSKALELMMKTTR